MSILKYLGFVPPLVVWVPAIIVVIWRALYFKECMDGLEFVVATWDFFVVGGILNLIYIIIHFTVLSRIMSDEIKWSRTHKMGNRVSFATVLVQVVIICWAIKSWGRI